MNLAAKSATALTLVLALAACGGAAEESDDPAVFETPAAVSTTTPAPGAAPAAAATAAPGETATPTPTPSAGASASPTPSPTASPSARATAAAAAAPRPPEFAQCSVCHSVDPGKNGLGPTLAGVFGAKAGHIEGFDYSEAMENSNLTWNQANLDRFLADPMGVIPGTKMAYPGLKDPAKRRAMIEYLKTL